MAHRIENPVDRHAEFLLGTQAGAFQSFKNGIEAVGIGIAPVIDDAYRDIHLSVDHSLLGKILRHAPRGQFVVLRRDEALAHRLERDQKPGEIGEVVQGLGFRNRDRNGVVALADSQAWPE